MRIFFRDAQGKELVFKEMRQRPEAQPVDERTIKIKDPTSNSSNYMTNQEGFIEASVEVKTPFISDFIRLAIKSHSCRIEDGDD